MSDSRKRRSLSSVASPDLRPASWRIERKRADSTGLNNFLEECVHSFPEFYTLFPVASRIILSWRKDSEEINQKTKKQFDKNMYILYVNIYIRKPTI